MEKLIITGAITGGEFVFKGMNENLPVTPEEVAEEAEKCREAGASVLHLHPKKAGVEIPTDFEEAAPDKPNEVLKGYIEAIRDSDASDIIINVTTGGGRFAERDIDEMMEERMTLGQEISSLNMGSINIWEDLGIEMLREFVFENPITRVQKWGSYMYDNGVKPELEIYDTGMLNTTKTLVEEGKIKEPVHLQLVMFEGLSCMNADLKTLTYCVEQIPDNWTWSVCSGGVNEMRMAAGAIIEGGHVRVGFEDNIYIEKGKLAESNAQLIEKVARIADELQREIATPDEAREILGL